MPQPLPKDGYLTDKSDICGSCCGFLFFFALGSGAVLERKTQTFGLKSRTEVDEMNVSQQENRCYGSCSVDNGLHIKRKILGCSS